MSSWSFKPPWWAIVLVMILIPVMIALGFWQLERGRSKAELQARYFDAAQGTPQALTADSVADTLMIERATVRGRYDPQRQLLLDNQSHRGRPGYHVLTTLQTADGGIILVDRGWIPLPATAAPEAVAMMPAEGEQQVEGYWRSLPVPGMRLASDNCAQTPWPRLVQYPSIADLRCIYGERMADGLLLLDPAAAGGYVREWQQAPELSPDKNYGYAVQWFAFALTLLIIFIKLNLRRTHD
jgi:surfeit locus 1 family protein